MTKLAPLTSTQQIVRICLFLMAAIAIFSGTVQMALGQPGTTPRMDNMHRFMAGLYLGCGLIALWTAVTLRRQATLVYLLALTVLIAAVGRLISMYTVGLPSPHGLWLTYLAVELVLPGIVVVAHRLSRRGVPTPSTFHGELR